MKRYYNKPRPASRLVAQRGYTTSSPYNRMWLAGLNDQIKNELKKRSLTDADFFTGDVNTDPNVQQAISAIAGLNSGTSQGATKLAIAALLLGLEPTDRAQVMRAALYAAQGPKKPIVPALAMIPDSASVDQARKLINGMFSILLAVGSADGGTTVNQLLRRSESLVTGHPYAGDPTELQPGEATLAQNMLAATVVDPQLAKQVFSSGVAEHLSQLADHYDCGVHVNPLGGQVHPAFMQGSLWSKISNVVKKVVDVGDSVSEAVRGSGDSAVNEQITTGYARKSDGTYKDFKDYSLEDWWDAYAEKYPDLEYKDLIKKIYESYNSFHPDAPLELPDMADEDGEDLPNQDDDGNGKNDHTDLDDVLDNSLQDVDSFSKLRRLINSYSSSLTSVASQASRVNDEYRQAQYDLTKAMWMKAIADAPESVTRVLGKISPDASTPTTLFSSILALMPAMRSEASPRVMRTLLASLRDAVSGGHISAADAEAFMYGDPTTREAIANEVEEYWSTDTEGEGGANDE